MSRLTQIDLAQTFSAAPSQRFEIGAESTVEVAPQLAKAANEAFAPEGFASTDYAAGVNANSTFNIEPS